jgi:hypothetical protein
VSLDNTGVVDAIGLEAPTDTIVLTVLDSWEWGDEQLHLKSLQEKLNSYFAFIESGQIYDDYPSARGKSLRIDVIAKCPVPNTCVTLLAEANSIARQLEVEIKLDVVPLS